MNKIVKALLTVLVMGHGDDDDELEINDPYYFGGAQFNGECASCITFKGTFCFSGTDA